MRHRSVSVYLVVPWHCADGRGGRHRLLLLLPGGKELTHHGVIQEPHTSGGKPTHLKLVAEYPYLVVRYMTVGHKLKREYR